MELKCHRIVIFLNANVVRIFLCQYNVTYFETNDVSSGVMVLVQV